MSTPYLQPHGSTNTPSQPSSSVWSRPRLGVLKCNTDGSWKENSETCGVGWILRDDKGLVRWHGMKTYPSLGSPLETEAAALVWTMNLVDNLSYSDVVFEIDCKALFEAIHQPNDWL